MNMINPLEWGINALLLLGYVFANFRLTRLYYHRPKYKISAEFVVYLLCFLLSATVLFTKLSRPYSGYPILPYLLIILCQYGILFLYQWDWKQNLFGLLKLFGADFLVTGMVVLQSSLNLDAIDWQLFFLLLSPVKLIVVLMLESAFRHREKDRLALQMHMYQHQMEIMEQSQKQIRLLRHDMKNHLLHMKHLLLEQDTDKLLQYVGETTEHLDIPQEYVCSGNRDIDSLLNYKLMTAKQLGAEIVTDIKIPMELQIPSFDLNVILGNLLDNALEALGRCDDRRLMVSLRYESGLLYILMQNTCDGKPPAVSIKGVGHGLGLHSIRHTLEAYHGNLKIDYHDTMFTATVMLYLNR
ncbi:MAG: GHKL domain-containing protein [Oscillospiraceae bacterium]|nr:GHKL domain-containing protein [Oscillospiraceae bacterium]